MKLTIDGQIATAPLEVLPDPRVKVASPDLAEQVKLALSIRDQFNILSGAVEQLRAIRKQLQARKGLLKEIEKAKPLVKASTELIAKLDVVEGKLHNPKAQVPYDILAMKGGAQLYSNLGWLYGMVLDGDGRPGDGKGVRSRFSPFSRKRLLTPYARLPVPEGGRFDVLTDWACQSGLRNSAAGYRRLT